MDRRLEERATEPRYTITRAAELVDRPANTVRRWSLGHRRKYHGEVKIDEPLITTDGSAALPLSLLNLLELQLLSEYRSEAALQAIRRALAFVAKELKQPRPLISVEFRVRGGELFTKFGETREWDVLVNASGGGDQVVLEKLADRVQVITSDVDYDPDILRRWWFKGRSVPLYVDTRVAGGLPITSGTCVRLDAIAARHADGYSNEQIQKDTGATETEIVAAILAA
jgi:uncharacterized protein (DUF433 family)